MRSRLLSLVGFSRLNTMDMCEIWRLNLDYLNYICSSPFSHHKHYQKHLYPYLAIMTHYIPKSSKMANFQWPPLVIGLFGVEPVTMTQATRGSFWNSWPPGLLPDTIIHTVQDGGKFVHCYFHLLIVGSLKADLLHKIRLSHKIPIFWRLC